MTLLAHVIVAAVLATIPVDATARDRVDVAEVHHFYDDEGRLVFDQLVLWDFCRHRECESVVAWRLIKGPSMIPERNWHTGGWVSVWQDGEIIRRVDADSFRERWTQYDVETADRLILPPCKRRGLSGEK